MNKKVRLSIKYTKISKGIDYNQASAIIGNHFTEVSDKLTNFLQLSASGNTAESSELMLASIEQKANSLQPIPFGNAINFNNNKKYLPLAIVPVLLFAVFYISGNSTIISQSLNRVVHFNATFLPPAPFKFVVTGGQIVNPVPEFENYSSYPVERKKFLDKLAEQKIPGVIFISGDRHSTNLQKLEREGTYPLYDFTISPLTSGAYQPTEREMKESPIVEGTMVNQMQTFGIMEVSGKRTDRVLKINVFDKEGKKKWDYEIKAKDLR
mgnify:CR=1 FL=1